MVFVVVYFHHFLFCNITRQTGQGDRDPDGRQRDEKTVKEIFHGLGLRENGRIIFDEFEFAWPSKHIARIDVFSPGAGAKAAA